MFRRPVSLGAQIAQLFPGECGPVSRAGQTQRRGPHPVSAEGRRSRNRGTPHRRAGEKGCFIPNTSLNRVSGGRTGAVRDCVSPEPPTTLKRQRSFPPSMSASRHPFPRVISMARSDTRLEDVVVFSAHLFDRVVYVVHHGQIFDGMHVISGFSWCSGKKG